MDKLLEWNCPFCDPAQECIEYLFFRCPYSSEILRNILHLVHFHKLAADFSTGVVWALRSKRRIGDKHKLYLTLFGECI